MLFLNCSVNEFDFLLWLFRVTVYVLIEILSVCVFEVVVGNM